MATRLVYDGSAFDTAYIPGRPVIGKDGKAIKRAFSTAGKLERIPIDTYELWGLKFPKFEEVVVSDELIKRGLVKKAFALKCFKEVSVAVAIETAPDAEAAPVAEPVAALAGEPLAARLPKRRGRPPRKMSANTAED